LTVKNDGFKFRVVYNMMMNSVGFKL